MMRLFFLFMFILCFTGCSQPEVRDSKVKMRPEHSTEISDPEIRVIVNQYLAMSKKNNIYFKHKVSIGLTDLQKRKKNRIGLTTYGNNWREIDIDLAYWTKATWESKIILLYHELTHAYCERDHDWDEGKMYIDPDVQKVIKIFNHSYSNGLYYILADNNEGFYKDGCPVSLMHPIVVSDKCTKNHYSEYIEEMFDRCEPY